MRTFRNTFICLAITCGIAAATTSGAGPDSWVGDLSPIAAADWNYDRAAYLLERAGFGGTPEEIQALAAMTPQQAVRYLVRYQDVPEAALPTFHESGIFPANWSMQSNIRSLYTFVMKTFDKLPADQQARLLEPQNTGVTEAMRRVAKTDKQAINDAYFFYNFADRAETQRLETWLLDRALKTRRPLQEKLVL